MRALGRFIAGLHQRLGWAPVILLMAPVLWWVSLAARKPVMSVFSGAVPNYVLSGRMMREEFDIAHAGSALDQSTIGKWLFLFTVMAVTSLPYAAAVGWLANRRVWSARLAYGICSCVLGVCLLCMPIWPVIWLIQYVCTMGFTPKRVFGLLYSAGTAELVMGYMVWSFCRPGQK